MTRSDLHFKRITVSCILNRMQRNKGKSKKISYENIAVIQSRDDGALGQGN